jgi:hypothetical protein
MGRRSPQRRIWLATLTLVGLFLAGPASSSGGRERDLNPRPSCPSAVASDSDLYAGIIGSPDGGTYDCVGAPSRCREFM